jgi:hypothetical protein
MVFCTNCQTEIEDSKMFLHEGFCKKNIKYCFKCKEKVPIEEFDEHCEKHNNKKEEEKKENKNEEKENIGIECRYCSLLVDNNELEEHEKMCGSRTVECEICGQYVQTRLLNQHLNVIHDVGYKDNNNNNFNKEKEEEDYNKQKQIEEDEILARKLAEEYNRFDMNNSFRHF